MKTYDSLREKIQFAGNEMSGLLQKAETIEELPESSFGEWKQRCTDIAGMIAEDGVRIAVVGAIKSGKSTFVNALFGGDYLKRGAGVVTSIVTKVQSGKELKATLFFKNWDEVNQDLEHAMVLLPGIDDLPENTRFDLRRPKDRSALGNALKTLGSDQLITNDTKNANSVLLAAYLEGFERVKDFIGVENETALFKGEDFAAHREFVGSDALSVYLKDVVLNINKDGPCQNVEIADCQGSDSPNPLHLAMIQEYLLLTNLSIYVISSRTGLRQADIRFLSIIKKMGILDNTLFVVNCDFSEHESIDDLKSLVNKTKDELSLICPDPDLFALSSLFYLFKSSESELPEREKSRLSAWRGRKAFVEYSNREKERFDTLFQYKVSNGRVSLLFRNHLERLEVIANGLGGWVKLHRDLLAKDSDGAGRMAEKIRGQKQHLDQMKNVVKSTLDGAVNKIRQDFKGDVDSFFDDKSGGIVKGTLDFIRNYHARFDAYDEILKTSGFASSLYIVFQEFRQAVDAHMTEKVNPDVIKFAKDMEIKLGSFLDSVSGPYEAMINEAMANYANALQEFGINFEPDIRTMDTAASKIDAIKSVSGLTLPPVSAALRYSAHIKTEAVMRFGAYKILKFIKLALKKPVDRENEEKWLALKDGVRRMKSEAETFMLSSFKNYRENFKFQYILKLADNTSGSLYQRLSDCFRNHVDDLANLAEMVGEKKIDTRRISDALVDIGRQSDIIKSTIIELKDEVNLFEEKAPDY